MSNTVSQLGASLPLAILSTWHIVVLILAMLLLFGGKKLPELARGLARGMRIFRDELHGVKNEIDDAMNAPPPDAPKKMDSKPDQPIQDKKDQPQSPPTNP